MSNKPVPDLKAKLLTGHFAPQSPQSSTLSDPLEPVSIVLTLDQLRPYKLNPRVKKNPKYEEIKESIRARGLDSPPQVTRRAGEEHYFVHNGGNTRLQALNELWQETRDEKFYRILCTFKPWKGDIVALTGHMAENDLRGNLQWIERCMGVSQAKALYEEEDGGKAISQSELARRLKADGYPIDRSLINRMEQTLQYLFTCIPNILWNGMGVDGVRALLALRSNAEKAWDKLIAEKGSPASNATFDNVFSQALGQFDEEPEGYVFQHAQDELIGLMTDALRENGVSYELILFEIEVAQDPEKAERLTGATILSTTPPMAVAPAQNTGGENQPPAGLGQQQQTNQPPSSTGGTASVPPVHPRPGQTQHSGQSQNTGSTVESIPVTVGGLAPVSDIWKIYPQQDSIEDIRNLADLIAMEIASGAGLLDHMTSTQDRGLGFTLRRPESGEFKSATAESTWQLLASLSGNTPADDIQPIAPDDLAELLIQHLPDDLVIKLFRMIRLARRAKELDGEV